jgi:hypothetical protein
VFSVKLLCVVNYKHFIINIIFTMYLVSVFLGDSFYVLIFRAVIHLFI